MSLRKNLNILLSLMTQRVIFAEWENQPVDNGESLRGKLISSMKQSLKVLLNGFLWL